MMRTLQALLLSILLVVVSSSSYSHNIYIDPNAANDTKECVTSNSSHIPCKTLSFAFEYHSDSTRYILPPNSTHRLTRNVPVFENLTMLAIVGEGSNTTVICDGEGVGLAFYNVSDISFADVKFLYCSAKRNSTSKDFTSSNFTLCTFNVGLYFYLCEDVSMQRVTVSSSRMATGVVMYDTVGTNLFQDSIFTNNTVPAGTPGGGGFYLEFSYCIPGDDQCNDQDNKTSNHGALYSFTGCNFTHNAASNEGTKDNSTFIVPYRSHHQAFGRGGGLSIFVKGTATGNKFNITSCFFGYNTAQWGGGLFLEFHDETANNSIFVSNCTFIRNTCNYTLDTGTGGGGMRIGHYVYNYFRDPPEHGNRIEVLHCHFFANWAMYGGGLSISPTLQRTEPGGESIVRLIHVDFNRNTGKIGAALHVGLFPLLTAGLRMFVGVLNCTFEYNTVQYADLLGKADTPHTIGVGVVYINQVPVDFEGENQFVRNQGTPVAVVGSPIDFTQSHAIFSDNVGYRGGAIALLGSTYILVDNFTRLDFVNNLATDKGGAIYNKYIEMDNLMTQPNCFVRHTNPFLNPDDWMSTFVFAGNVDLSGNRNNSIHTSSVLPCARAGGNGYIVNTSEIFCWKGWDFYDTQEMPVINCSKQITSEAGQINLTEHGTMSAVPGRKFKLPLKITDDFGNDLVRETVFSSTYKLKYRSLTSKNDYFWGGNATVTGPEGAPIQLTFESLGDRIWHINLPTELLPCPPGLKPTKEHDRETINTACKCSNQYLGAVSCDPDTLKVRMNDKSWIGKLNSSGEYLVGTCPPAFCKVTETSFVILPTSSEELSEIICTDNRKGILCGECIKGYGPAVNSKTYDCVNCTDIDLGANIAKYVASIYLPLAALFTVLILFDIRLTTGPANAFILYCQMVSSTLSLDADGHIPLNRLDVSIDVYEALIKSYKVIYGIFNLDFFENLLSPFCFSSDFSTLTVLSLDYGVALFPLLMIIVVVICLKMRECLSCSARTRQCVPSDRLPTTRCCSSKWNVNEALLPAFAAFVLLSYTKFSLTSSYIIDVQALIDEDGNRIKPPQVYYAGQFNTSSPHYRYAYLLPSSIVFATFVCIPPLLLLSYPLMGFEWCLAKVRFLWKYYPVDKVHVFLDTFQGCYRNNMRFFAGLYFLFRLVINISYFSTDSWIQQFIVQQVVCVAMLTLVAVCRPYVEEKSIFNYVDILIFANLVLINSLTFYLYTVSMNGQPPPLSAFVFQYILVFLPLLYMLAYLLWYLIACYNRSMKDRVLHRLRHFKSQNYEPINGSHGSKPVTRTELAIDDLQADEDEALFDRARATNQYRQANGQRNATDMDVYDSISPAMDRLRVDQEDERETDLSVVKTSGSHSGASSNGYGTMSTANFSSEHSQPQRNEDKDN